MTLPTSSTALRHHEFAQPTTALKLETIPLPALGPQQVLIKVLASPINPADTGRINGTYGDLAELPSVGGMEGVGVVAALGANVSDFQLNQRVFVPTEIGAWQTYAIADAAELFPAPEGLSIEDAAMGWVNPATAWKLLHDFANLKAGDWIIQNAGTSAVAKLVIQFARHKGIRTANLVRSLDSEAHLKELGADLVLIDGKDAGKDFLKATGGKKAKLAFNSVGAVSAYSMCRALEDHGTLVTFGAMDREMAPFPTRYLIFNDIRLRGLWVSNFYKQAHREEIIALHNDLFTFMENAKVSQDVEATYPLEAFQEAFANNYKPGKKGKVLFKPA